MSLPVEIFSGKDKKFISAFHCAPEHPVHEGRNNTLVIMAHGFPGGHKEAHEDLFGDLEFLFNQFGYQTLRFDFRGCGNSEGMKMTLPWPARWRISMRCSTGRTNRPTTP